MTGADDPLMTVPQIAGYAATGEDYVRRHMHLSGANPAHLPSVKHAGRLKAHRSWVNDWIANTSTRST